MMISQFTRDELFKQAEINNKDKLFDHKQSILVTKLNHRNINQNTTD